MNAKEGLIANNVSFSAKVDPKTSLFELLKVYNQIRSNCEDAIKSKLLDSMDLLLRKDIISRIEFDLVESFVDLFKKAKREDLAEGLAEKAKVVKSLSILLKGEEILLRRATTLCEHQIGELYEKTIFLSEATLVKEKLRKAVIYSKSNSSNTVVNIVSNSELLQVRVQPNYSVPGLLRQLEVKKKLSALRVSVPMGYRIGFMLEEVKLFAVGAGAPVGVIVDDCLIFMDSNSDLSEVASKFESRPKLPH